jgi:orotate phosphoribosyltransferase
MRTPNPKHLQKNPTPWLATPVYEELLKTRRAVLTGHFLLTSGLHSDHYVQCARLFEDPKDAERLGRALSHLAPRGVETIVSPALGGVLIGYEVAKALGIRFLFTERDNGKMALRRGFHLGEMEKIVVVEDVFTTGGSTLEVMEVVRSQGAQTIGVLSVINRGCDVSRFGVPAASLVELALKNYEAIECPMCAKGIPVVKPGSRAQAK